MEMLDRARKSPEKAAKEMQDRLTVLHLANMDADIEELMTEFKKEPRSEIWTSILNLKQEKEKLTEKMQK